MKKSLNRQAIASVCRMDYTKRHCPSLSQNHTAERLRLVDAWLAGYRAAQRDSKKRAKKKGK